MKLITKAIYMCMVGIFVSMSVPAYSEYSATESLLIKDLMRTPRFSSDAKSPGDISKNFEDDWNFFPDDDEDENDWDFLVRKTALCGINQLFRLDAVQLGDKEVRGVLKQYDDERFFVIMITDSRWTDHKLETDHYCCRSEIGYFQSEHIVLLTAKGGSGSKLIKLNLDGTFISAKKVKGMFGPVQYTLSESEVADLITEQKDFWKDYFKTEPNPVGD